MQTIVQKLDAETFDACLTRAASCLLAGDVCALPTETVYGLCADASNEGACQRLYEIKGRDERKPGSLPGSSVGMAGRVAVVGDEARRLFSAFSPGPLTLVLPKKRGAAVAGALTAGGGSVGIRIPDHPFVMAVLERMGRPIAATSANPAGEESPVNAEEVLARLGRRIPLLIDGGATSVRLASTVAGWQEGKLRLYREGSISLEDAMKVLNSC